jgi:hypothetical protein
MTTLATDVTVTDHGHLITARCRPHGYGPYRPVQVAYAVRDQYGWAIMRRASGAIRTVRRIDGGPTPWARGAVIRRLQAMAEQTVATRRAPHPRTAVVSSAYTADGRPQGQAALPLAGRPAAPAATTPPAAVSH